MTAGSRSAVLVTEDGRRFAGQAYGAIGTTFGEAVFATGMTGYQETLTDPSYHRQVVVQTAPHIGNTGMNDEDPESSKIWVSGYVVRDPARRPSSSTRTAGAGAFITALPSRRSSQAHPTQWRGRPPHPPGSRCRRPGRRAAR